MYKIKVGNKISYYGNYNEQGDLAMNTDFSGNPKEQRRFREVMERYCYVIDENAPVCKTSHDNEVHYECLNLRKCNTLGGCRNRKFCGEQ